MPRFTRAALTQAGPAKRKTRQTENMSVNGNVNKQEKSSPPGDQPKKKRNVLGNVTNNEVAKMLMAKKVEQINNVIENNKKNIRRSDRNKDKIIKEEVKEEVKPVLEPVRYLTRRSLQLQNKTAPAAATVSNKPSQLPTAAAAAATAGGSKRTVVVKPRPPIKSESPEVFFDAEGTGDTSINNSSYGTPAAEHESEEQSETVIGDSKTKKEKGDGRILPEGVQDYDKEQEKDVHAASAYAYDIFQYFKEREQKFKLYVTYMPRHPELNTQMRGVLVDWMVEVQENFELNHESLYMAVKLLDLFLDKTRNAVSKDLFQLLGVTCIFISTKFEERSPPLIEDFLYICEDAYTREELLEFEEDVLRTVDFDIGFPLSYSFLRRYARTAKHSMVTLTLARYFLESSLLDFRYAFKSESKVAASSLLLAIKITKETTWNATLEYYSGYSESELVGLMLELAQSVPRYPSEGLKNVLNKYSHPAFFEVAKKEIPRDLNNI